MPQHPPTRSVLRRRCGAMLWAGAVAAAAAGAAVAGPAPEYGPEAEARFLQHCADSTGMDPADCRRLNERLQTALGYEAYLAHAAGGPEAFARRFATRCLVAEALRRDGPGCGPRAAAIAAR